MLKKRIHFLLSFFSFWFLFFVFSKLAFILFHADKTSEQNLETILGIFYHGLKLDVSAIAYILIIPVLTLIVTNFFRSKPEYYILKVYTSLLIVVNVFFLIIDLELYKYWGFRLDKTPLNYIHNPADMMASTSLITVLLGFISIVLISAGFIYIYNRYTGILLKEKQEGRLLTFIFLLFLFPFLLIPIRGGFDTSPVNHSSAYFSNSSFANHAALNLLWNVGESFTSDESIKKYHFLPDEEATKNFRQLTGQESHAETLLNNTRPNILLIILESFTAKIIEPLGGLKDITPGFNRLSESGILFTNFYAAGDRSDKGVTAILSGFPAFGTTSVLKYPEKSAKLPSIAKILSQNKYSTAFYYGGDINFFNFKAYFISTGFGKLVSKDDFPAGYYYSKWGVPDGLVFERLLNDLKASPDTPFFKTVFTLTSHEPFEFPAESFLKGNTEEIRFLNAIHYTDSCLSSFMEDFKKTGLWNNTLVVILADHGSRHPGNTENSGKKKFHIPMLWTGGVVEKDTVIPRYGSQVDFSKTLINQLALDSKEFTYGKDLLSPDAPGYAFYSFNDGFGFVNDSIQYVYDNFSGSVTGDTAKKFIDMGKSFIQVSYRDLLDK